MAHRARKLHVTIRADRRARVSVCRADEAERRAELISSTDGIVAMETRKPGEAHRAFWRIVATVELDAGDVTRDNAARAAFFALCEPDVYAIHVVDSDGDERTYLRDTAAWLHAPRFPHPLYKVAPERA